MIPNKLISYDDSVFSKFNFILKLLDDEGIDLRLLHNLFHKKFKDTSEFVEIIDLLYILNKLDFIEGKIVKC